MEEHITTPLVKGDMSLMSYSSFPVPFLNTRLAHKTQELQEVQEVTQLNHFIQTNLIADLGLRRVEEQLNRALTIDDLTNEQLWRRSIREYVWKAQIDVLWEYLRAKLKADPRASKSCRSELTKKDINLSTFKFTCDAEAEPIDTLKCMRNYIFDLFVQTPEVKIDSYAILSHFF